MPFFSVIIPTYNRGELIYPTLDSVLGQSERDFELIVVDDGSTDATLQALERYADRVNDSRLRVIRRENGGTTAARNTGMDAAAGEYIALLDHDDLLFPWTLETHRQAIEKFNHPSFCAGSITPRDSHQLKMEEIERKPLNAERFDDFLAAPARECPYYPSGWTVKADVLRSIGGFFHYNRGYEDHDLMLRLGDAQGYVRVWAPTVAVRGLHDANLSSDKHLDWFMKGLEVLMQRERDGEYPGGPGRAPPRRKFICAAARPLSLGCLRVGKARTAWTIYRETFRWHLRFGRIKFLAGFPAMALLRRFRPQGNHSQ
jgi:glycosyltransferase involved in cell wall biosynthesis